MNLLKDFIKDLQGMKAPRVLELGTLRSEKGRSTRHDDWAPNASEFLGTDLHECEDVDIIADIHSLSETCGHESFDAIISCSTFEHFKYPQLAAHEIMKVLKPNGIIYIQTHQTFPLHAYPYDYYRFSKEALSSLFATNMGFHSRAGYEFPAKINEPRRIIDPHAESYLNVCLYGKKIKTTPSEFLYEL